MEPPVASLLSPPELTPLEQDVLDEYERLAENMKKVCLFCDSSPNPCGSKEKTRPGGGRGRANAAGPDRTSADRGCCPSPPEQLASVLDNLSGPPSTEILDGLRELERKTSLVFTLLKASVYSIVLQQEIDWGDQSAR